MRKLVIDRKIWLRGIGDVDSYLLQADGDKMCCVGIYLDQCGVPDEVIRGQPTALNLKQHGEQIPEEASWLVCFDDSLGCVSSEDAKNLYSVNDNMLLNDSVREAEIVKWFALHDVEVEFVN